MESHDVAVVGAGLAGLVAARRLREAGLDVVVIEARDRVGGRTRAEQVAGTDLFVEMGGQWIGPTQDRIRALIAELGLETYPTHDKGMHTLEFGGFVRRYTSRLPWLGALAYADTTLVGLRLDRAARRLTAEGWSGTTARALDRQTFGAWLKRRTRTDAGSSFFRIATEMVFGAEPEEVSALSALLRVGAAGGLDPLITIAGGAQQDRVVGGAHRICQEAAVPIFDAIRLSTPVTAIDWSTDPVRITAGDRVVLARRVVLAVPPPLAAGIQYTPELPQERAALLAGLPMGSVIKVNIVYEDPFWRRDGLSGYAISDTRALTPVFDNTPFGGGPGVLAGFLHGGHGRMAANLTADERHRIVIGDLVAYFGERADRPIAYHEQNWSADPWAGGGPAAFATPRTLSRYGSALRAPIGPLHHAGSETAAGWAGYLDGAVESGERAAGEVIAALRETRDLASPFAAPGVATATGDAGPR